MINTKLLKEKIASKYPSQIAFTNEIGWHRNKIGRILRGVYIPDIRECEILCEKLNMDGETYLKIFMPFLSPFGDE